MRDLDDLRLGRRVDALLRPWRDQRVPGVTVGVVRDGGLILNTSAGFANLELNVPIGPTTAFRIASVSKQFTCAAILMCAADGLLDPADPLRRHIPEFPDYGHRLTIAHLMHNTSGIRDMFECARHGGADLGERLTRDDFLSLIYRQSRLNFPPGTRYLYSNSSFLLLGVIVERVSGQRLPTFLNTRIFAPLGMTMTCMTESPFETPTGLATGYYRDGEGGWRRAQHGVAIGGEGGLVSSVEDLALWARNMETKSVGGAAVIDALEEATDFAGGSPNVYLRGLQSMRHRGLRVLGHGGSWPGFRTQYLRVPDKRVAIIVISNDARTEPFHIAYDVLDAVMVDASDMRPRLPSPTREALDAYCGRWIVRETGHTVDIERNAAGHLMGRTWGAGFRLAPTDDDRLTAVHGARDFIAKLAPDGVTLDVERDAGVREQLHRAPQNPTLPDGLAGRYECADMNSVWTIAFHGLEIYVVADGPFVRGRGTFRIEPIDGDAIRIVDPRAIYDAWMDVRVLREASGEITGLHADGGRVRGVVYKKVA